MFDLTQQAANAAFGWFNFVLIIGATLVLIGTIGAIWTGGIREKYASLRVSNNELETAKARDDAARANLQAETAKAEYERLKSQLAWRTLTEQQARILVTELEVMPGSISIAYTSDPETMFLAKQLGDVFGAAKWTVYPERRDYADWILFGIYVPGLDSDPKVQRVRAAFKHAQLPFRTDKLPPPIMSFRAVHASDLTIMIGTKNPPY